MFSSSLQTVVTIVQHEVHGPAPQPRPRLLGPALPGLGAGGGVARGRGDGLRVLPHHRQELLADVPCNMMGVIDVPNLYSC